MGLTNLPENNQQHPPQLINPKKLIDLSPHPQAQQAVVRLSGVVSPVAQLPPAQVEENPADLLQELETARQLLRYQQSLIDSLTQKLTESDRQIVQLEEELVQAREQRDRELKAAAACCDDLRTRLQRQQHQTYQYKVALEQCVETSMHHHRSRLEPEAYPVLVSTPESMPTCVARTQPIQPWSVNQAMPDSERFVQTQRQTRVKVATVKTVQVEVNHAESYAQAQSYAQAPQSQAIAQPQPAPRPTYRIDLPSFSRR